jgi:Na+/H+-dicarboxylate symporter
MPEHALMNSTSLNRAGYGRAVLAALTGRDPAREEIVAAAVNDESRWTEIKNGAAALTFPELARALKGLQEAGHEAVLRDKNKEKNFLARTFNYFVPKTPFDQKEFYDFLRNSEDAAETVRGQLHKLREESKAKSGFLSTAFNIFSAEKPLEKIVTDVNEFAQYCVKNRISFEPRKGHLVEGEGFLQKNRFLIAAVGGALTGAVGIDPTAVSPEVASYPGFFFSKILPAFVVPFTALSLFKTASREGAAKDSLLFARFAMTMTLGAALSIGLVNAEKHLGLIGSAHMEEGAAAAQLAEDKATGFNPAEYMMDGVKLGVGAGVAYGMARYLRRRREGENAGENEFGIGGALVDASNFMSRQFNDIVTFGGVPAIYLLLGQTIAQKGFGEFGHYGGLYATAFGSMGLAMAMIGAGFYKSGVRNKQDWQAVYSVAKQGFCTSSSAATIDTIRDSLKHFGVSEKTRDLTPLATAFHMFGPTVCLGAIALYANAYYGHDQTLLEQAETLSLVIASMLAVRGVPTANAAMLSPVLHKNGLLTEKQIGTMSAAIMGPDRLLDMCETAVNTTADLLVLKWHDNSKWADNIARTKNGLMKAFPVFSRDCNEPPPEPRP